MLKYFIQFAFILCGYMTLSSCAAVQVDFTKNVTPEIEQSLRAKATFTDYRNLYFFGTVPKADINVAKVCLDEDPLRVRTFSSLEDILFTTFSLGIYSPRTVEVWCGEKSVAETESN